MPSSNEPAGRRISRRADMAAYDKLPVTVRRELANALHKWSASYLLELRRRERLTARELVEIIREDEGR